MYLERSQKHSVKFEANHYKGSLDFPCDFCNKNPYDNFHFHKSNRLVLVICGDCIKKLTTK
jgi:transcription elongation factor Elf1